MFSVPVAGIALVLLGAWGVHHGEARVMWVGFLTVGVGQILTWAPALAPWPDRIAALGLLTVAVGVVLWARSRQRWRTR